MRWYLNYCIIHVESARRYQCNTGHVTKTDLSVSLSLIFRHGNFNTRIIFGKRIDKFIVTFTEMFLLLFLFLGNLSVHTQLLIWTGCILKMESICIKQCACTGWILNVERICIKQRTSLTEVLNWTIPVSRNVSAPAEYTTWRVSVSSRVSAMVEYSKRGESVCLQSQWSLHLI
jgi:hypothetical protein